MFLGQDTSEILNELFIMGHSLCSINQELDYLM